MNFLTRLVSLPYLIIQQKNFFMGNNENNSIQFSQVVISQKYAIYTSEDQLCLSKLCQLWILTCCKTTHLGVLSEHVAKLPI